MILTSAVLALVVTPMFAPASSQKGQNASRPLSIEHGAELSGFSVVLVIGETQAPTGAVPAQELPPGARRALNDMREFLPYKHFRILDAQWMSCCALMGPSQVAGRLEGPIGIPIGAGASIVRAYGFTIVTTPRNTNMPIRFVLFPEDAARKTAGSERARDLEREKQDLQAEIELLDNQIAHTRSRVDLGIVPPAELPPLQLRQASLKRKLADVTASIEELGVASTGRPIIDSSFTMSAGETVVVGTSKLGGDKALIALVTAVKKNAASRDNQTGARQP